MTILFTAIIGAVLGWLAGTIRRSKSSGILGYMILGIIGGFAGNQLYQFIFNPKEGSLQNALIFASIGSIVFIIAGGILFRKKPKNNSSL